MQGLRAALRHQAELLRRGAEGTRELRRRAAQGVPAGPDRVQGQRLVRDRQPDEAGWRGRLGEPGNDRNEQERREERREERGEARVEVRDSEGREKERAERQVGLEPEELDV